MKAHVYRRRFSVRGYEMGANGHVHDRVFLNYVQQAAFEASADAGYDTRRYDAMGALWVIRKQTIAFLAPLTFGDTVEAKTWVSDIQRVRSHRECELRRVSDGQTVALTRVDWVYVDAASLFPRRIPFQIQEALKPNGVSALDAAPPLEAAQEVDGRVFVYPHRVKSYEQDNLRHVNNANYLNWLSQARLDAMGEVGIGDWRLETPALHPQRDASVGDWRGELSPVRYEIEYFVPAVAGERVEVRSRVVAAGKTQLTWEHEVRRGEARAVKASATVCFVGDDGSPVSLPAALLAVLVN
jgi:YbgC/YbaW family acyl-CoA thioester hydrolase